jgi:hypothetical protein
MSETNELPDDLGTQLVDILYSNTRLNYDVCAVNLVAIFEHLGKRLPDYRPLSQSVIDSIQVGIYFYMVLKISNFFFFFLLKFLHLFLSR